MSRGLWGWVLCVAVSGCASHSHLLGRVEDRVSHEPLSGLKVRIDGVPEAPLTDPEGWFEIDLLVRAEPYVLRVTSPGYEELIEEHVLAQHEETRFLELRPLGPGGSAEEARPRPVAQVPDRFLREEGHAHPHAPAPAPGDGPEEPPAQPASSPESATPEPASPESATPEPASPESATPEPASPESATPESATPEPPTPEPATPEPATRKPESPEPAPGPTPRGAQAVFGHALLQAQRRGALGSVVSRVYVATHHGEPQVVRVTASAKGPGLALQIASEDVLRGATTTRRYAFDGRGVLSELRSTRGARESRVTFAEGEAHVGARGEGEGRRWGDDSIPSDLWTFVLPSLHAFGIPRVFEGDAVPEALLASQGIAQPGSRSRRARLTRAPQTATHAGRSVHLFELTPGPAQIVVAADGDDAGRILEVRVFEGGAAAPHVVYAPADAEAVDRLRREAPRAAHEAAALKAIARVHWAQGSYARRRGRFAASLAQLGEQVHVGDGIAAGRAPGYRLAVRCSPNGRAWMIVATPDVLGETGRYVFATTELGTVYRSEAPIALNAECTIPAGLDVVK